MEIINNIKDKFKEYNSIDNRHKRLKDNTLNQKARKEFQKIIKDKYSNIELSEEQEAVLFSQAYKLLGLKNPSAAKFPDFDEYEVVKNGDIYKINGYTDATNSYGAQIREKYSLEVLKKNDEWTCITNTSLKSLILIIVILLLIFAPTIIGFSAIKNLY